MDSNHFKSFRSMFCATVFSLAVANAQAENGVSKDEIVLGQTTALTGPLAELGQDAFTGAKAYFDHINAQGGVNGRKIRLVTLDDGYNTAKATENAKTLIEKERVFALFNVFGTPANIAILPLIEQAGVPSIAPLTGADAVRKPFNRLIFNVRAGYEDEIDKVADHMGVRGIDKIAVVYQNNAFGKEGLAYLDHALANRKLKVHAAASIENDASDAGKAVKTLIDSNPKAVLMITAGKPSAAFIKIYNKSAPGMQFFTLSPMGSQASVNALGKDGIGVVVAQVAPFPFSATSSIVREYQKIMTKMDVKNRSFISIEGFLSAKVVVEGLKRAGPDLTRERFISGMESLGNIDLDGYVLHYGKSNRRGSQYVELTVISKNGRFMR